MAQVDRWSDSRGSAGLGWDCSCLQNSLLVWEKLSRGLGNESVCKSNSATTEPQNPWQEKGREGVSGKWGLARRG